MAKSKRRTFSNEKKLQVVREADRCKAPGALGALLRREGLYWSMLSRWRQARDRGELSGTGMKKRGPKKRERDAKDNQIRELEKENRQLRARAERAEALIEVQKESLRDHGGRAPGESRKERERLMKRVKDLGDRLGVAPTCNAFGIPRASYYRWLHRQQAKEKTQ